MQGYGVGADVVGGIPWLERSYEESFNAIDCIFEIAKKYDKDVHFLDNTLDPNSRTIEYIALKAIKENYRGRAVISSAPGLSVCNRYYVDKVMKLLKQAQVNFSTNIEDSMSHGKEWPQPRIRAIMMVTELLKAGVNVSCGQDCVNDTYYPLGKNDMLECFGLSSCSSTRHSGRHRESVRYDHVERSQEPTHKRLRP